MSKIKNWPIKVPKFMFCSNDGISHYKMQDRVLYNIIQAPNVPSGSLVIGENHPTPRGCMGIFHKESK